MAVDAAVRSKAQDGWRTHPLKVKTVRRAIQDALDDVLAFSSVVKETPPEPSEPEESDEERLERLVELVKNQNEY